MFQPSRGHLQVEPTHFVSRVNKICVQREISDHRAACLPAVSTLSYVATVSTLPYMATVSTMPYEAAVKLTAVC